MSAPNQTISPQQEMDLVYKSIIDELDYTQLDRLEYLIKDRRFCLSLDKKGLSDKKATDFIDFICDYFEITVLNKTKTDTRSGNYWRCIIHYLTNIYKMHERDIARLISRHRTLVLNQLKGYDQLSNVYTERAELFKKQRKEFEQAVREYHNGSKVNKVKY